MNEIKLVLTSSKVVILFSWLAGAKTCTFRCGSRVKWGPRRTEHHHLLQLGVVIHGRVREAQGLWELQSREDHLGLGCSHPLLVLELQGWGCSGGWREVQRGWVHTGKAAPRGWRKSLLPSSESADGTLLLMLRKMQLSAPRRCCSVVLFSLRVKIHRIAFYAHSLRLNKINQQSWFKA